MTARRLHDVYGLIRLQLGTLAAMRSAALRPSVSTDYLERLGFREIGDFAGKASARRLYLKAQFSRLSLQVRRQAFVDLVAAFEADVFHRLGRAISNARHVLNLHYDSASPFARYRGGLLRTAEEFRNLGGVRRGLWARGEAVDQAHRDDLLAVIAHRDHLAHGERFEALATPPTLEEAYGILSRELDRIDSGPAGP